MPTTLNVGVSRKVGEPNYGSRGASIHLEVELDSAAVTQPDRLRREIRLLFEMANNAVTDELNQSTNGPDNHSSNGNGNANGYSGGRNNSNNGRQQRAATESQARAIRAIANRHQVNLDQLLSTQYGVQSPEELSIKDASRVIDNLKSRDNNLAGSRA